MAATQHLSFVHPLAAPCARGDVRLFIVAERDLDGFGLAAFRRALADLVAQARPTVVVFSRAGTRFAGDILAVARGAGARVVAHLDDDLFNVPEALGAAKAAMHNDPARLARLMVVCRRADAIYASTAALGEVLADRFPDRTVIPGALYAAAHEPFQAFRVGGPPVFGYMGTAGHGGDLEAIAPAIADVLTRVPQARFETFGTIKAPPALTRFGERVTAHPRTADYPSFLERLKGLGWRAGLAPLNDTPFNACKADTKFVEYAQSGIPSVLARGRVYARPLQEGAAWGAHTPQDWADAVVKLLEDEAEASRLAQAAQACLRQWYSVGTLEAQAMAVLAPRDQAAAPI
ncbi:MAG: hypothetical protein NW200_14185 [Hyphomonadaceae bacterium]|nr:hypothetical protein [Hyphomonadaceae bacterium]